MSIETQWGRIWINTNKAKYRNIKTLPNLIHELCMDKKFCKGQK